jgi:hypothetical protein
MIGRNRQYEHFIRELAARMLRHNPHLLAVKFFPAAKAGDDGVDEPTILAYGVYGSANGVRRVGNNPSDANQGRAKTGQSSPVTPEAI